MKKEENECHASSPEAPDTGQRPSGCLGFVAALFVSILAPLFVYSFGLMIISFQLPDSRNVELYIIMRWWLPGFFVIFCGGAASAALCSNRKYVLFIPYGLAALMLALAYFLDIP